MNEEKVIEDVLSRHFLKDGRNKLRTQLKIKEATSEIMASLQVRELHTHLENLYLEAQYLAFTYATQDSEKASQTRDKVFRNGT